VCVCVCVWNYSMYVLCTCMRCVHVYICILQPASVCGRTEVKFYTID
jgi:hypothetical protein